MNKDGTEYVTTKLHATQMGVRSPFKPSDT